MFLAGIARGNWGFLPKLLLNQHSEMKTAYAIRDSLTVDDFILTVNAVFGYVPYIRYLVHNMEHAQGGG